MKREWIDDLLDAWESVESTVDWRGARPFGIDAVLPYYYPLEEELVRKATSRIDLTTIDPRKLSAGPTGVRELLCTELLYHKYFHLGEDERDRLVKFYRRILSAYSPKDPFTYHGTNKIYNDAEVLGLVKRAKWQAASPESSRAVGKLLVSLASITYALYGDMMPNLGREFHGPYDVSKNFGRGTIMIARDYFNIKPVHLWRSCRKYKFKSVLVLGIYRDLKIRFDYYGNYTTKDNMQDKLLCYAVFIDGRQVTSLKAIKEASEYLARQSIRQANRADRMDIEQTKQQFLKTAESFYLEMYRVAGMDWRPTKEMYASLKGKKPIKGFGAWGQGRALTKKELKMFKSIMDPRTEVYYSKKVPK